MAAPTVPANRDQEGAGVVLYQLLVLAGDHVASHRLPSAGTVIIGRAEEAEVRVVDPLASRNHARLHLGERLHIEDLGSGNGTAVREERIPAHQPTPLAPGDAITIGSTVLVVRRSQPAFRPRAIWPHGYFEIRLIETCAAAERAKSTFAVARVHLAASEAGHAGPDLIAAELRAGDVLASYGPDEYELLLPDTARPQAERLLAQIGASLERAGFASRTGLACFPTDGTSPQALVANACARLRGDEPSALEGSSLVLENRAMRELYAMAGRAAKGTISILIVGETGVGKEILARAVHRLSTRAQGPYVCVNCAALSESLLESELFGHEKSAFTGAGQAKAGLLEAASGGTLFLDEVGEMSPALQAKVLRAIETREVLRVGATRARAVDVRFVAATNRDLEEEVAQKSFREDLYFRLNGITLAIPPLRERPEEIEALARQSIERVAAQIGRPPLPIAREALALLRAYPWPGNIRELRNTMERALLLATGGEITVETLPAEKMRRTIAGAPATVVPDPGRLGDAGPTLVEAAARPLREIERQAIIDALGRCAGNQTRAAELLGIPRRTLCAKLREHNIPRPRS